MTAEKKRNHLALGLAVKRNGYQYHMFQVRSSQHRYHRMPDEGAGVAAEVDEKLGDEAGTLRAIVSVARRQELALWDLRQHPSLHRTRGEETKTLEIERLPYLLNQDGQRVPTVLQRLIRERLLSQSSQTDSEAKVGLQRTPKTWCQNLRMQRDSRIMCLKRMGLSTARSQSRIREQTTAQTTGLPREVMILR
jgi:hypothetical protein